MAITAFTDLPDLAKEGDVSEFTGLSVPTLRRWRSDGTGPKAIRLGSSVRYRKSDVLAWLNSLAEVG